MRHLAVLALYVAVGLLFIGFRKPFARWSKRLNFLEPWEHLEGYWIGIGVLSILVGLFLVLTDLWYPT